MINFDRVLDYLAYLIMCGATVGCLAVIGWGCYHQPKFFGVVLVATIISFGLVWASQRLNNKSPP